MTKRIKGILVLLVCPIFLNAQNIKLVSGMKISRTGKVLKNEYKLDGFSDNDKPVILIEGDNIIVDFNHSVLQGSNQRQQPDEFFGVALLIRNSRNITIKNLVARGYKVALLARNVENLVLENCDFSYNYRQHLNSTQEKEDVSDWMSYHHNENDEWLRYGAAMYLRNCNYATVKNCKVTGGQNALMLMECNDGLVVNNDFSFNSGIGIGMYKSSRNRVMFNRVIFNVRGYSHGIYNRGQDSAGMLVYEQSSANTFYKNNVTHGGDGFFLWAGQTTMDTGKGGCNDNLLLENDFSYAPTNGIEVTFSSNKIIANRLFECDHGIWGGYSYSTIINDNKFRDNRVGIAIEHGQNNQIWYNNFSKDKEAIRLWARKEQPADWVYAQKRDTRSRDYSIAGNSFNNVATSLHISRSSVLEIFGNTYSNSETHLKTDSTVTVIDSSERPLVDFAGWYIDTLNVKAGNPFKEINKYAGRKNIMMTEWGPYAFTQPFIWNTNPTDTSSIMKFDLLGPAGNWKIKSYKGIKNISAMKGKFPAVLTAEKIKGERTDIFIELEYSGMSYINQFGKKIAAGKPSAFYFEKFFQPIDWEVLFFSLDTSSHNPIKTGSLFSLFEKKAPFKTEKTNKLDYAWWGGIKEGSYQHKQFITSANGSFTIPKGQYELSVTWDDAVRIYLDEMLVLDEWNPSKYKFDESPNRKVRLDLEGFHRLRVEHLELGGFATLGVKIRPIKQALLHR